MSILSKYYGGTLLLSTSGSYASPLTITSTGRVVAGHGSGVEGVAGVSLTLINQGTVIASNDGVYFGTSGIVTNSGLIAGGIYSYGIQLKAGGTITNTGLITG